MLYLQIPFLVLGLFWFFWFRYVYFYRDPMRKPPNGDRIIVAPADGRVMYVYSVKEGKVIVNKKGESIAVNEISKTRCKKSDGWLIGIYMSPFDVHYNYAPISGRVMSVYHYKSSLNLPMVDLWEYINFTLLRRAVNLFSRKFHFVNERMTIEITNMELTCFVILIADKFVNKIRKFFKEKDELLIGEKICFIERGSQVDLFLPVKNLDLYVREGEQVYGCKTIIGRYCS
jgi:phosphatidylserine decarboxylase